ncbi:hypothetical protein P154DRAFT_623842 [Amniculicola lignicola CBS 123094]|uniref:DUF4484 domain-containing protein n=1 Tax=Amniculicola lignicola CBS 123094 TaxID=1392246 RepID=A0A6A5W1F5_9PLEO|nr:hypothetical protein P154DRAFT_623842 [Amniculicola lignicola CBS 123094]
MSASSHSSATNVDAHEGSATPQLAALFLIRFDKKIGYTIAWKRSSVDVSLDGDVEYKSLPSGLHAVKSDLVYFVHEGYAGLSAFVNGRASEAERNANFVAVGILVPLSYGRLGRSWVFAEKLMTIASALADDPNATAPLEQFWETQSKLKASVSSPKPEPSKGHSRARALSSITAVIPSDQSLPPYHPALSIFQYIDVFGPLVFRLQQAALLRKRILFVGPPPVRAACEFVYNLSILSSIPNSVSELLSPGTDDVLRLRSLFSIGVHDIPLLEKLRPSQNSEDDTLPHGWVACTTDEIIATKKPLYDIIVELPHSYDTPSEEKRWPSIKTSDGTPIRASQRDLSRFKFLHRELRKYRHASSTTNGNAESEDEEEPLLSQSKSFDDDDDSSSESYSDAVAEPVTWSHLAYLGFMWWASAGEKAAYTTEERESDREVLGDLSDFESSLPTAIIAYFHRSTSTLVTQLAGLIEAADDESDDGEQEVLSITKDDISRIGLDTWSEADKAFVEQFLWMYFGRRAQVTGASLDCCGVRVPVF